MRKIIFAALFAATAAAAQEWPNKPVRWVVPFPPGGSVDIVSRLLQSRVTEGLGRRETQPSGGAEHKNSAGQFCLLIVAMASRDTK